MRDAHRRGDDDALARAYAFAQWCHHQRAGSDLPNAVGVAFDEHLFDDWSLRHDVAPWLEPSLREAVWPLWAARLAPGRVDELQALLDGGGPERWRGLRGVVGRVGTG